MKTLITWIVMMAFTAQGAFAARLFPSKGRVVNEQGEAVEYATVVLLKDAEQVAGMTTDGEGRFELKAPAGDYTLRIQYLGYESLTQQVKVEQENDLGDFVMKSGTTQIEGGRGQGPAGTARSRPVCDGCGQRPGRHRQGRH